MNSEKEYDPFRNDPEFQAMIDACEMDTIPVLQVGEGAPVDLAESISKQLETIQEKLDVFKS